MVNEKIGGGTQLKKITRTRTTSANGNLPLTLTISHNVVVAAETFDVAGAILIPYAYGSDEWGLHVVSDLAGMNEIANTNLTVTVWVIEI